MVFSVSGICELVSEGENVAAERMRVLLHVLDCGQCLAFVRQVETAAAAV